MEITREERQQMRQRGAGTRKAKEVNFGFSFGSPLAEPSAPAPLTVVPEAQNLPQIQTAPNTTPPLESSQPLPQDPAIQRTPRSARNKLPARPSTYDILSDDRGEQTRSNKRRKLSSKELTEHTSNRQNDPPSENGDSQSVNGSARDTEARTYQTPSIPGTDYADQTKEHRSEIPQHPTSPIPETSLEVQDRRDKEPETTENTATASMVPIANGQSNLDKSPTYGPEDTAEAEKAQLPLPPVKAPQPQVQTEPIQPEEPEGSTRKRQKNQPSSNDEQRIQQDQRTTDLDPEQRDEPTTERIQRGNSTEALSTIDTPASAVNGAMNQSTLKLRNGATEKDSPISQEPSAKQKKSRGRARNKDIVTQPPERPVENTTQELVAETQDKPVEPQAEEAPKAKRPRGRTSLGKKTAKTTETGHVPSEPEPVVTEASPEPRRGRKPAPTKPDTQQEPVTESAIPIPQRRKPGQGSKRAVEPEEAQADEQNDLETDSATVAPQSRRGRPGKKAKHAIEPEPEPEPEPDLQSTTVNQPEPETEPNAPKARRGRPRSSKNATEHEAETETEPGAEVGSIRAQAPRKAREPRGETVPVTVYRLANVTSLGDTVSLEEGLGDDQESADELTANQRTKIPNRGGVNPADVLSQICRETLEKTLNTLKDGISNEANATRRGEWTRKMKAVEAFGSELESRLMDLSGMLDSNFVLGVQLKKSKREMMDLRSRLYRIRQERENVALQMDAVRSKHMEEEKAKISRTTVNNSLHSLELALDRNQQRPPAADSSPDLEFMLRTVADVSSRAPGAQGGLLNQIRNFNAQLQATMTRLER